MKVYFDDTNKTMNIVQSVASASTMISSVANDAKEYILEHFPKDYFKHIYIDTSETVTQQHINDKYNKNANKIPYPSMTITPEISLDDPIAGMEKGLHLSSPNLYLRRDVKRTFNKILVDPDEKIGIYYTSDYITTNFNFKITTNSFIQNADVSFFLKSRFQRDFFQFLNGRYIQTEIPKTFIKIIAALKGYDLTDPDEMDELRLYLIGSSKSEQAIQKRVNMSTGKQCFFINEKSNFLTLFTDLDCPGSVNREGQSEGEYVITFRFQVSCWLPNSFILVLNKPISKKLYDESQPEENQQEQGILALHTFNRDILRKKDTINFYDDMEQENIGHLIYSDIYTYSLNQKQLVIDNILSLRMKPEFIKIFSYAADILNIDLTTLIFPLCYDREKKLDSTDYTFDYRTLKFIFRPNLSSDISVSLYLNRLLFESIKKAMENDKNYFNSNYLTYIIANIAGNDEKIVVRSFVNSDEMYSSKSDYSLRVSTACGIGYASLLDEDNEKDAYKICVGFDKEGNPIIKQFELKS